MSNQFELSGLKKLYIIILLLVSIKGTNAQSKVASHLKSLEDYESRVLYYDDYPLSIDSLKAELQQNNSNKERLELLMFYLNRQFLYDISIGSDEAKLALKLARSENLRLHESIALNNLATIVSVHDSKEIAHSFADSALVISRQLEDHVLESSIYYTKYVIDLINDDHVSEVMNLLKSVELAEMYATATISNRRQIRLTMYALQWNNFELVENQLKKLNFQELELDQQTQYLIHMGHLYVHKKKHDSARYFFSTALKYSPDKETYFELGKFYQQQRELDSAILLINKSIELMDKRESYFDLRYKALAENFESLGQLEIAEEYLKKRIPESIRLMEKTTEAHSYIDMAQFYYRNGSIDSANIYALKSFQLAEKNNFSESIALSTLLLSQLAEEQDDTETANLYLKKNIVQLELNNELKVINLLKKAEIDREISYWTEIGNQKLQKAKALRNLIIVIAVLTFLLAAVLFILFINKRLAWKIEKTLNKLITEKNDEILAQDEELKATNDELSVLNYKLEERVLDRTNELKSLNERLSIYSQRLEQYAKLTAHNLRGPLANIKGLMNVFNTKHFSGEDMDQTMNKMIKPVEEMDDVIHELSALMDLEIAEEKHQEWVEVEELVDALEKWLFDKSKSDKIQLKRLIAVNSIFVVRHFLERSLQELLINSFNYRNPHKPLVINLHIVKNNRSIEILVEDNGTGIDLKSHGNKMFNLHQRFHETTTGRGVGLYLVKRQIEALDGSVKVRSSPGEGAAFTIDLPQVVES